MTVDELVEHCLNRAGEELRMASWFNGESFGVLYRRDDIDADAMRERVTAIQEQLTWEGEGLTTDELEPIGDVLAHVQVREEVATVYLPTGDQQGIVLGFEVGAARDLHQFIVECRTILGEEFSTRRLATDNPN